MALDNAPYTDKKETKIFFIYKEIQNGSGCKVIYEEGLPDFLIYEENFVIFFISLAQRQFIKKFT
jgi:hypothetical protein